MDEELLDAAHARLQTLKAPVVPTPGPAVEAMERIVQSVHRHGLHFAFLDPHNLGALSFDLFKILTKLKHVDIIVHISIADLQRNVDLYTGQSVQHIRAGMARRNQLQEHEQDRAAVRHSQLLVGSSGGLGLTKAKHSELIKGPGNQRLYWLSLLSRRPLAHKLWDAMSSAAKQSEMF